MNLYDRNRPFLASVKERYCLCGPGSPKSTHHIVIDLKGSNIQYDIGDSIGIYPVHSPMLVERTLKAMNASGEEIIIHKRSGDEVTLETFLMSKANITEVSRKFISEILQRQTNSEKRHLLQNLLENDDKAVLKEYIASRELWDILEEHKDAQFSLQEICDLLMPLLPRLYSISSSQKVVGDEVHLTVAILNYTSNDQPRRGVCTHYLEELSPMQQPVVPVYLQPTKDFRIPEDHATPIIMIGPGTGVAPFRAFMQERDYHQATGGNWLFFGEWNREKHFFYEDFWTDLEAKGKLKVDLAFSRDQAHKVYVQDKMLENSAELYAWIENGACIYLCGDKNRMAKDVEQTLQQIIQQHGKVSEEEAQAYLKNLRKEKRYLKDVY